MARPVEYSIWSDLVGASTPGTRLVTLKDVIAKPGPEDFSHIKRHEYTADLDMARGSSDWTHVAEELVVRYQNSSTASDFDEFRIRDAYEGIDEAGRLVGRVSCVAPVYDLDRSGVIEWVADDGTVLTHFPVGARTPTAVLGIALGNTAPYVSGPPGHFKIGTIDPTALVEFVFQDDTAWTAILELAKLTGTEFWWDRDPADDQYRIHLLTRIGGSHEEVRFEVSRNIFAFEHRSSTDDSLTRVTPVGATIAGERASIANNAWAIASTSPIVMVDPLVLEDDQLNLMGVYAEKPDGTLTAVTDCAAPSSITLADETGLSAGDVLRFRRNAAGADMSYLDRPSEAAKIPNPPITATLDRPDVRPIDNEASPNAYLTTWGGGLPTGYSALGSATITQNTNEVHQNYGVGSARVIAPNIGDGIARVSVAVSPTDRRPFFTPQCWLEVISGKVEMLLYDVTNDVFYPDITATERAATPGLGWQGIGMQHGVNHVDTFGEVAMTTLEFEIWFQAAEVGTEFYLDAVMLTNTLSGVEFDAFLDGRGSNLLWIAANDELEVRPVGLSTYQARVADLNRLNAVKWPDEPIEMGGDARIVARMTADVSQAPFEASTRILGRRRFREDETRTEVEFETERERLTRQQTERKQRAKQNPILDHLKPPRCGLNLTASLLGADLIIEWDRTNWSTVQLRDVTGLAGGPRSKWDAGVILFTGKTTDWTLLDQRTTPQGATSTQIKTVMIEAYNHWGKPGGCFEEATVAPIVGLFKCSHPNLLPDASAGTPHCTADCVPTCTPSIPAVGTPPIVLHTFAPLVASAAPSITPGVTTVSLCHEGSTVGSGTAAPQGFGSWTVSALPSQTHQMYGTYVQATQRWSRARTIFSGVVANPVHMVACSVMQESGQIRQYHGFAQVAPPGKVTYAENRLTSSHVGELFRPGVAITDEGFGDLSESRIYYSNGYRGSLLNVSGLTNMKVRVDRLASENPWLAAHTHTVGPGSGTVTFDERGANLGGGMWTNVEVLDASDVQLAIFNGYEHPSGRVWVGDEYTYDAGGGLVVGVGGVIAINAAATLGLTKNGFLYEENWTNKLSSTIDPAKYVQNGFTLVPSGYLSASGNGNYLMRIDVGEWDEVVSNAVVFRFAGNPATPPGAAVLYGGIGDVQSTLRATFDDGTVVTGTGVSTGSLATYAAEQVLGDFLWPAAATQLVVEQLHIGTDPGEACSKNVMLNVGPQCCTYVDPSNVIIGLPSTNPGCILSSFIGTLLGVDTCAGGQGVRWFHNIFWDTSQACVNITAANGYFFEVLWFEENDPVGSPGILRLAAKFIDPVPIPTGWAVGDPPVHILYLAQIRTEDISQVSPTAGANRGSDGTSPQLKQWRAEVRLKNQFLPNNTYGLSVSNTVATPNAYGWCP